MNRLIYILFLAAKVINLLANVTASEKSRFLGLVLGLTLIGSGKWHFSCTVFSPAHLHQKGLPRMCFQYFLNSGLENTFHKKK